jgi:hypothetical protein
MSEHLHPLTLGETLDRTAQLYRSRFLVYFGIGFIPAGTVLVCAAGVFAFFAWAGSAGAAVVSSPGVQIASWIVLGLAVLVVMPVCLVVTALGWAAMSYAAARAFLGEAFTIREAYKAAWKRRWRYTWLYALAALIVAVAPGAVFFAIGQFGDRLIALGNKDGFDSAGVIITVAMVTLLLGLMGFALWMLLRLSLVFPAGVVEQMSAWGAVKRSSALSKGTRGSIFLLFVLGSALGWLLAMGFMVPVGILLALVPGSNNPQHQQTIGVILTFIWYGLWFGVQALTKPVYGIALTLFYFNQRIRKEGFDIEWMMLQAGMSSPEIAIELPSAEGIAALPAGDSQFPGVSQT